MSALPPTLMICRKIYGTLYGMKSGIITDWTMTKYESLNPEDLLKRDLFNIGENGITAGIVKA